MNPGPDQTNDGADPRSDDRLESSEQVTDPRINPRETDPARVDTDPQSTTTQVFSTDYQKVLPERYRLIEMIGRGGMAEVFLAEDTRLHRRVAIKFLTGEFRKDLDRTRRFTREARAASALNHPNILIIHDISENDDAQFIVSEYVEGETLAARIRRGKIPLVEAVNIAIQVASALAASHKAGIVHRDVKPDNIMIRPDGSVKVLDFGLAKETEEIFSIPSNNDGKTLDLISTSPGLILGTPQYMSPEQTRGVELDPRTDIFSLGNIIFEMVTGRVPFPGKSMVDILAAIISKEPRRLEEYLVDPPLKLISIVDKALRKEREQRYAKMEHLLADLKELQQELLFTPHQDAADTGGIDPRSTVEKKASGLFTRQFIYPELSLVLLAVVGIIGIIAALFFWIARTPQPAPVVASRNTVPVTSWSSTAGESAGASSFSPDGKMVAFAATKSDATEIWMKPIGGGDPVQVTKNGFYNQYPVWSPSGQEIAFFSSRGESRGIWRAGFTGGDQIQMVSGIGRASRPMRWTTDGKIYYQDGSELFTADGATGRIEQITHFASTGVKPWSVEISDDGSWIAYSIKEGDVWRVKIQMLDSGPPETVAESARQIDHLAWSPDGKSVIFSSSVDGVYQIFEKTIGAGEPIQLSTGDHDLLVKDISADGTKILYGSVNETSDLWTVGTEDPNEAPVANDVANEFWADLAPDGKMVAFQSVTQTERPFGGSIDVLDTAGKNARTSVSKEGFSPEWSPDGQWIAFFRRSQPGFALWCVRPTGDDLRRLSVDEVKAPDYTPTPYLKVGTNHVSWSSDSQSVVLSSYAGGVTNIWLVGLDGSTKRQLTQNNDTNEKYSCPIWTPDGKSIVFISENEGTTGQKSSVYRLWLYQLDNAEQRLLYESGNRIRPLGLGAGSRDIIFTEIADPADRSPIPKSINIFSVSLQSGTASRINALGHSYFHNIHLSPDGSSIAFVSRRDNTTTLWTVPVRGGTLRKILGENDPKILISSLAWSPDGSSIVFGKQTRTNLLSMLTR